MPVTKNILISDDILNLSTDFHSPPYQSTDDTDATKEETQLVEDSMKTLQTAEMAAKMNKQVFDDLYDLSSSPMRKRKLKEQEPVSLPITKKHKSVEATASGEGSENDVHIAATQDTSSELTELTDYESPDEYHSAEVDHGVKTSGAKTLGARLAEAGRLKKTAKSKKASATPSKKIVSKQNRQKRSTTENEHALEEMSKTRSSNKTTAKTIDNSIGGDEIVGDQEETKKLTRKARMQVTSKTSAVQDHATSSKQAQAHTPIAASQSSLDASEKPGLERKRATNIISSSPATPVLVENEIDTLVDDRMPRGSTIVAFSKDGPLEQRISRVSPSKKATNALEIETEDQSIDSADVECQGSKQHSTNSTQAKHSTERESSDGFSGFQNQLDKIHQHQHDITLVQHAQTGLDQAKPSLHDVHSEHNSISHNAELDATAVSKPATSPVSEMLAPQKPVIKRYTRLVDEGSITGIPVLREICNDTLEATHGSIDDSGYDSVRRTKDTRHIEGQTDAQKSHAPKVKQSTILVDPLGSPFVVEPLVATNIPRDGNFLDHQDAESKNAEAINTPHGQANNHHSEQCTIMLERLRRLKDKENNPPVLHGNRLSGGITSQDSTNLDHARLPGSSPVYNGILQWRSSLREHQKCLFDQLVSDAENLVSYLAHRETLIQDLVDDYRRHGHDLVKQMEISHATEYKKYCIERETRTD